MKLSKRQSQIAGLIADDFSVEEIASKLGIQLKTVLRHTADARQRLGLDSTVKLANWQWRRRLRASQRKPTYNDVEAAT